MSKKSSERIPHKDVEFVRCEYNEDNQIVIFGGIKNGKFEPASVMMSYDDGIVIYEVTRKI